MFGDYRQILPEHLRHAASTPATGLVALGAYNNRNDRQNLFSQTDLVWENRLAGHRPDLLVGFRARSREVPQLSRLPASFPTGNTRSDHRPDGRLRRHFRAAAERCRTTASRRPSPPLYVQDQIRPADWLEIVAGLRFDSFKIDVDDFRAVGGGEFGRRDKLWSPRLGMSSSRPTTCPSTPATAAPTCRNRATSSAA